MTQPTEPVASIVRAMHDEVIQQFDLTRRISHPGESGRAREDILRRFLRRFVPQGLGVDTGFVVDSVGGISKQIDIVIYRDNYHPVVEIGGLKHFLVESVIAAIQIKARITSRSTLHDALDNVRSVKALDKSAQGRNYVVLDFHQRGPDIQRRPHNAVWTAIISEWSMNRDSILAELNRDMEQNDVSLWLNCYVAVHDFASRYVNDNDGIVWYPEDAHAVVLTDPGADGGEQPLVDFAFLLAHQLRHAAIVDYTPESYFPRSLRVQGAIHVPGAHEDTET